MKKLLSLLLVFTLILSTAMTVNASDEVHAKSLEECVKIDDLGHLYLSEKISSMDFDENQIVVMNEVINSYNNMLDSGYYTLTNVTEVVPTEKYYQDFGTQTRGGGTNLALMISANLYQIWINDSVCQQITRGLNVGSVFAALISNPVVAVGVAAVIVGYSSTIDIKNQGNGVTFKISTLAFIPYDFQPQ